VDSSRERLSRYDQDMATVHMSEAEVASDLHGVLAKVQQGVEVVIERNHRPVAIIKPPQPVGRRVSEIIADLTARGSSAVMDDEFARDIEEGIKSRRQPWEPPSWD
jgi:antitoxin (DNA-binding transcriptional repressor) of toxin-antitoxin stability system